MSVGGEQREAVMLAKMLEEKTAAAAKSLQSCLTLCDIIDGSPPRSPIPGILQARTLEEKTRGSPNLGRVVRDHQGKFQKW